MNGCTFLYCKFEGRPSRNCGVRTGAGPFGLKVALLCLQQYGAASAAPILPDDDRRRRLSVIVQKVQSMYQVNRFDSVP